MEMGFEGYGIFWAIVEELRKENDYRYPISDIQLLAYSLRVDLQKIEKIIANYDLFHQEGGYFYSNSLIRRMEKAEKTSEKGRDRANKRWGKDADTGVGMMQKPMQEICHNDAKQDADSASGHASISAMQIKGKEIKEKKRENTPLPPSEEMDFDITGQIARYFGIRQYAQHQVYSRITRFVQNLHDKGLFEVLEDQFKHYCLVKDLNPGYKHNIDKYLGTFESEYSDGAWNTENWKVKYDEALQKNKSSERSKAAEAPKIKGSFIVGKK
jgi:hypothetical protein